MAIPLQFEQVGAYPYPVATTGLGTAMTVCRRSGDPVLAIATQTTFADDIVFLHLHLSVATETARIQTPPGRDVVQGLCYQESTDWLWAMEGQITNAAGNVTGGDLFAIDPQTGAELSTLSLPVRSNLGLAFNGAFFVRCNGPQLEAISTSGVSLGEVDLPLGSLVSGISSAGMFYVAADRLGDRLMILGPFGRLIAECSGLPGSAGGMEAVAYDYLSDFPNVSQVCTEDGSWGAEGTPEHPETPWSPQPWLKRHHIYIANEADQTIYFGYLYR